MSRGATLIGAPLAGLLIAGLGAPGVLVLDAVSFGLAACWSPCSCPAG